MIKRSALLAGVLLFMLISFTGCYADYYNRATYTPPITYLYDEEHDVCIWGWTTSDSAIAVLPASQVRNPTNPCRIKLVGKVD